MLTMKQHRITISITTPTNKWLEAVATEDGKSKSRWVSDVLEEAKRDRNWWMRHTKQTKMEKGL